MRLPVLIVLCSLLFTWLPAQHQEEAKDKYWIFFTNKGEGFVSNEGSCSSPECYLSPRALERRKQQGIKTDWYDRPVEPFYPQIMNELFAIKYVQRSRWLNAVSAWLTPEQVQQAQTLPFVSKVKRIPKVKVDYEKPDPLAFPNTKTTYNAGMTAPQLDMVGLSQLHQNGLTGTGVLIAVMDNGYNNLPDNPVLSHLFDNNRILATRDFVGNDVYAGGAHGTWVLSILAGWYDTGSSDASDFNFIGSAPGATYILCRTENDASETHQEEDNWVAAMEFADSLGADILSTSLGYKTFDAGEGDYTNADMDGNTTIITRASDLAASRGMLVINSAGNSGQSKLNAPADGDSVMAVGAVNATRAIAGFSSVGPSADGRIKPDLCAMGQGTFFVGIEGQFRQGSGTSFSCPVVSGLAACLMQAKPTVGNMELFNIILRSCDRYTNPDTIYGHGIPDAGKAYSELTGFKLAPVPDAGLFNENGFGMYPNPVNNIFYIAADNGPLGYSSVIEVFDMVGRRLFKTDFEVQPFYNTYRFDLDNLLLNARPGIYVLRVKRDGFVDPLLSTKFRIDR